MEDLLRAYRTYQKMMLYPHLIDEIRGLFLVALTEKGVATPESIREEAQKILLSDGLPADEENIRQYGGSLIDLHFVRCFRQDEIESYINLARKKEAFEELNRVVNTEDATPGQIRRALKEFTNIPQGSLFLSPDESEGVRVALINHFITNLVPFISIAKHHLTVRDIDEVLSNTVSTPRRTGRIGGKAAGMILAYKALLPRLGERDPQLEKFLVIPESYYFESGITSDFIDYNRFYYFHSQKYKTRELIEEGYAKLAPVLEKASFPPDVMASFRTFLAEIGEHPLILRSSSLLEDNIGYTFSGKYESVFLANQGDIEGRLASFVWGLKRVLMSTFSPAAILYRRDHNLLDFDERMGILVQKVVGRRFGDYFFPFAAGVAFSRNEYAWTPRIKREEGLVRLVLGLGTRAVERVEMDYPRMIALSHPTLRPEVSMVQVKKYSQKIVDVLNLETGKVEAIPYVDLFERIDHPDLPQALSTMEEGGYLSPPLFTGQEINLARSCVTFDNFLAKTPFTSLMKEILQKLEAAYGRPVEVEFAWDDERLYLLQCRSLAVRRQVEKVAVPGDIPNDLILFTNNRSVANSITKDIEFVVYVDPKAYSQLSELQERSAVGRVVGKINVALEERRYALLGPARWGSNDIKFGVKVGYDDINHTLALGEIAFEEAGVTPEVSYGTHFFNDLVEARIVPLALYPDQQETVFREDFLIQAPNLLTSLAPDATRYASVVRVIHIPSVMGGRMLQIYQDGINQKGIGFFDFPENSEGGPKGR